MSEEDNIEISLKELKNLKNSIFNVMELIGDLNITGYTREKLRKDTQRNLVEAYDILFALNRYLSRKTRDKEGD